MNDKVTLITTDERYTVITEKEFVESRLCNMKAHSITNKTVEKLKEQFHKTAKGYNFVIKAGDMIYGVEYFNNRILGNNNKKSSIYDKTLVLDFEDIKNIKFMNAEVESFGNSNGSIRGFTIIRDRRKENHKEKINIEPIVNIMLSYVGIKDKCYIDRTSKKVESNNDN